MQPHFKPIFAPWAQKIRVVDTVVLENGRFVPCRKQVVLTKIGENSDIAFCPQKQEILLLRIWKSTKMTKMAGVRKKIEGAELFCHCFPYIKQCFAKYDDTLKGRPKKDDGLLDLANVIFVNPDVLVEKFAEVGTDQCLTNQPCPSFPLVGLFENTKENLKNTKDLSRLANPKNLGK